MMGVWLPEFACPECRAPVSERAAGLACSACARQFPRENGIFRFLTPERASAAEPFCRQYRTVRAREGYRAYTADDYRSLPFAQPDNGHETEWALRRESYRHLQSAVAGGPLRVLDLGAGNAWLSNRLTLLGHRVVAVDRLDDPEDGLGACRHYGAPFACVQADFDALPFAPGQFDLVVFNGSLHYSADVTATLARSRLMLNPGGTLAVMDSPIFHREDHGRAMVAAKLQQFTARYGLTEVVHSNVGFLTFGSLACAFERMGLRARFVPSRGPLAWQVRRGLARIRLRRAPAAFGTWIAQQPQEEARGPR